VQRGERQLELRLDTCRAEGPRSPGSGDGVIEECRLARAGSAAQNQYAAASGARAVEQCVDRRPFAVPSVQHHISIPQHPGDFAGSSTAPAP